MSEPVNTLHSIENRPATTKGYQGNRFPGATYSFLGRNVSSTFRNFSFCHILEVYSWLPPPIKCTSAAAHTLDWRKIRINTCFVNRRSTEATQQYFVLGSGS